ncbi:F-box protein At5g07610-like [Henckelia pumila]|uniref:F-box protein At5g07610-like n=1 Tax=Henckelia pumila TaxID=405737 RepID=UPI003C6DD597
MKTKLDTKVDEQITESSHIVASIEDLFYNLRNSILDPPVGLFLSSAATNSWEYVPFSGQQSRKPPFEKLDFDFVEHSASGIIILQSCNGLFLCCKSDVFTKTRYYVCNPTTKHFTELPGHKERTWMAHWMSLAFDPAKSHHYKVVCVRRLESNSRKHQHQIEIYSPNTGSWRICIGPFTTDASFENGVYWNGAIHWLSNEFGQALYFKIDVQVLMSMQMPSINPLDGWNWRTNCYFGESGGHLSYIDTRRRSMQFDVYEMKRDYSEWYVKYKVDLSSVAAVYPEMLQCTSRSRYSIISVFRGRERSGGDSFLVLQIQGKVVRFNLVSKTSEMLHELEGGLRHWSINVFPYIESLCCV